jgi:hypothetical protein
MTFETDFPSLRNKEILLYEDNVIPYDVLSKNMVILHCLDKQKVKDAIENNLIHFNCHTAVRCRRCDIEKELGLDK